MTGTGRVPPTAREWAEALWLAERIGTDAPPGGAPQDALPVPPATGARTPPGGDTELLPEAPVPRPVREEPTGTGSVPDAEAGAPGPAYSFGFASGTAASDVFDADTRPGVVRAPQRLARALRPFNRRVRDRHRQALDEEATAERAAELGQWSPVLNGVPDRWFEVALVVEQSVSMSVWQGVARELFTLLQRQGAFADLRIWRLDTGDGKSAVLRPESGGARRGPAELFHPEGRRLILVLSDCVGDAWAGGAVPRLLHTWARRAPVAVLQPLPARLWDLCEGVPLDLRLRGAAPGLPNVRLQLRRRGRWARPCDTGGPVPVPVLELEPAWLAGWVRLVTGEATPWCEAAVLLVDDEGLDPECLPPFPWEERRRPVPPDQAVRRFLHFASPAARRLAARLAMVPLQPRVVDAVRRQVTRVAGPLPFAEILLGGLLSLRPERAGAGDPEPAYEFLDGVRGRLLRGLGRTEILRTLQEVTAVAGRVTGARPGLLGTLVATPAGLDGVELSGQDRELLEAARGALTALGPSYREALDRVVTPDSFDERSGGEETQGSGAPRPVPAENSRQGPPGGDVAPTGAQQPGTADPNTEEEPVEPTASPLGQAPLETEGPGAQATDEADGASADSGSAGGRGPGDGSAGVVPPRGPRPGPSGVPARLPRSMPLPNAHFAGREDELHALRRLLGGGGQAAVLPQALYGLGGVGKTRLAIEYIHRHHQEYERVWWIDAEQPSVIRAQLASIAPELGAAAEGPGDVVDRVLSALSAGTPYKRWLLVMDNAGSPEEVTPYIPSLLGVPDGVGHVLVTSRRSGWADRVRALRVDVFSREESVGFLRARTPWTSQDEAERLAESLGDLPLALEQCAALQTQTGIAAQDCLEMIENRLPELLAEPTVSGAQPVAAVFRATMDALREQHPGALELLRLFAFFGPEPIAQSFLHDARLLQLPEPLSAVARDPLERGRTIRAINQFSLLAVNSAEGTVQLHRLLRGVLQDELTEDERTAVRRLVHRVIAAHDPGDSQRPEHWRNYAEILPHIEPSGLLDSEDRDTRATVLGILGYLIARGDFRGAATLARRVADTWRVTLGPDDLQTLWTLRQQASAHWQLSEFAESRKINEDILARLRATVGDDHEYTLTVAGATAADLRAAGRFTEALALDEDAYERSVRLYGAGEPYTLRVGHNYGVSLRVNGLYSQALALDEQVYRDRLTALGATARSTLFSVNNVARDMRECGQYAKALALQERTLQQYRDQYGDEHPHTLRAIKNMSVTCRKAGEFERGLALAQQVLGLYRAHFGPRHIDTLAALTNLSNDLRLTGDPQAARQAAASALVDYRAILGEAHPLTSTAAVNHGAALRAAGEPAEALRLDRSTVAVLADALPDTHPWLLLARINLATDLSRAGEHGPARTLGAEAAAKLEARYGDRHPSVLAALRNLALDMTASGDTQEGADLLASVRRRYLDTLGSEHPESRDAAAGIRAECDIEPPPL
ncbi:FxSxx-COOH system tetratricopeptide repeat protein [Streptomyces sp. NPDC004685]